MATIDTLVHGHPALVESVHGLPNPILKQPNVSVAPIDPEPVQNSYTSARDFVKVFQGHIDDVRHLLESDAALKAQIAELKAQNVELKKERDVAVAYGKEMDAKYAASEKAREDLQKQVTETKAQLDKANGSIADYKQRLMETTTKLNDVTDQLAKKTQAYDQLNAKNAKTEEALKQKTNEAANLQHQLNQANHTAEDLRKQIETLKQKFATEKKQLEEKLKKKEGEVEFLEQNVESLKEQLGFTNKKEAQLRKQVKSLEKDVETHDEKVDTLYGLVNEANSRLHAAGLSPVKIHSKK
jgi:chromosome segregation ATPase